MNVITMTNTSKTTQTAAASYAANHAESNELLKRIAARLEQHSQDQAKRAFDWGYVGDLARVNAQLAEILANLRDCSAVDAKGIAY